MKLLERVEWLSRIVFLVFILASAAFLSAITAMRVAIHGREVSMPNLVGKNVSEASQALRSKGLILRVADRVYSDLPINQVVRQTPSPGMLMKVSQQAHVVLSLGQRELEIPPLEGNTLRVSRIELLRGGLQVGEVSTVVLPDEPADSGGDSKSSTRERRSNTARGRARGGGREERGVRDAVPDRAESGGSGPAAGSSGTAAESELRERAAMAAWSGDRPESAGRDEDSWSGGSGVDGGELIGRRSCSYKAKPKMAA